MKRDMDLIRLIVLAVEDAPSGYAQALQFDGYTQEQIGYHAYLVVDAGFAVGANVTGINDPSPQWEMLYLTWAGHEFAAAARDDSRWRTASTTIKEKAGTVTTGVLTQLLSALMKGQLNLP